MTVAPIYIVQSGDSLSAISKKLYGDFSKVDEIIKMNKITNPDLIYPGQQLLVPNVPGVEETEAEVIESGGVPAKKWIGKVFPWLIVVGAAVLLGREAMKQKKKNKALSGTDEKEFWLKQFAPRTKKYRAETLRKLKAGKTSFETEEERQAKIKALEQLRDNNVPVRKL